MTHRSGSDPDKLLISAPNWLGDLVMSTTLLEIIGREEFGGIQRGVLKVSGPHQWVDLLENDPRIDTLLAYDRGGAHAGLKGLLRLAGQWRQADCGSVILLPPSFRAALVAYLAGIPRRIGFRGDRRSWLLNPGLVRPFRGDIHYSAELALLFAAWMGHSDPPMNPWPNLPGCSGIEAADSGGVPVWALAIGTTYGEAKSWPAMHHAALIDQAVSDYGVRVVLLGDHKARATAAEIRDQVSIRLLDPARIEPGLADLVGRTDLVGVVSILKSAHLFLGGDSGLMHLSAALGTPTTGLFGSTNPLWSSPRGPHVKVVHAPHYACQPCYKRACDNSEFCLAALQPETVLDECRDLLGGGSGDSASVFRNVNDGLSSRPTIFIDRDGVMLRDPGYLADSSAVELLPGVGAALKTARSAGFRLVCLTNQSGIGRGYYSLASFESVQTCLDERLSEVGAGLDGVYYCQHAPEAACECRKPGTGMVCAVAHDCRWDPGAWMIGDKASDIDMGLRAGMRPVLVLTGEGGNHRGSVGSSVPVVADLAAAIDGILQDRWV